MCDPVLSWDDIGGSAEVKGTLKKRVWLPLKKPEILGKGPELVEAFDCAIHEAPCVLFISDCEWLCPRAGCNY